MVSLNELKDYIGTTGTTKDSLLEAALGAAEREILNFCRRTSDWTGFEASTGTRYYRAGAIITLPEVDGMTGSVLWLGADLQSVSQLLNGTSTEITSTGYWLEPRNQKPYRWIRLKTGGSWVFDTDEEIAVTGTWGYSTAPDAAIQNAVKETARYLLDLRASAVYDVTAMPDIGQIMIPKGMPKHVEVALRKGGYVRTMGVY